MENVRFHFLKVIGKEIIMNKKLILLPLIGGFLLAGCELQIGSLHIGGKKNSNSNSNSEQQQPSGDQGGEQQKTSSDVVLDFEESFWTWRPWEALRCVTTPLPRLWGFRMLYAVLGRYPATFATARLISWTGSRTL